MVTVIIPVFNGERTLDRCIRSVLDQKCTSIETIVIDNASTDGTEDIARQLVAAMTGATSAGDKVSRHLQQVGEGGVALPADMPVRNLSLSDFEKQLEQVSRLMENRSDSLGILESQLFDAKVRKKLMPTIPPVETSWSASSFGWRIDPITGVQIRIGVMGSVSEPPDPADDAAYAKKAAEKIKQQP